MLVAGGLCRCVLQRAGASCGAGKVHRLLRVPPAGLREPDHLAGCEALPDWAHLALCPRRAKRSRAMEGRRSVDSGVSAPL